MALDNWKNTFHTYLYIMSKLVWKVSRLLNHSCIILIFVLFSKTKSKKLIPDLTISIAAAVIGLGHAAL